MRVWWGALAAATAAAAPVTPSWGGDGACALLYWEWCEEVHGHCGGATDTEMGVEHCWCDPGYQADESRHNCVLTGSCAATPGACTPNGECRDDVFASCTCDSGYKATDDLQCEDIDECTEQPDICGSGGTCTNTPGSYTCTCGGGYELVDGVCKSVCDVNDNLCKPGGTCKLTDDSFACECDENGWRPADDRKACVDIDECKEETANCGPNTECINTEGSYECRCLSGYEPVDGGDTVTSAGCKDIDECAAGTHRCDVDTTDSWVTASECHNTEGDYECNCLQGFERDPSDSKGCIDIDECEVGRDILTTGELCGDRGACVNTKGSYRCACYPGYQDTQDQTKGVVPEIADKGCGDSDDCCQNIDECANGSKGPCHDICTDGLAMPSNYTCGCNNDERWLTDDNVTCMDCEWTEWSDWGPCSTDCGTGTYNKTRTPLDCCMNDVCNATAKVIEFSSCQSTENCGNKTCDVSPWGDWSECVDGEQTRHRVIINNQELCGSDLVLDETQECTTTNNSVLAGMNLQQVIGASVGAAALLGGIGLCAFFGCRRRRRRNWEQMDDMGSGYFSGESYELNG